MRLDLWSLGLAALLTWSLSPDRIGSSQQVASVVVKPDTLRLDLGDTSSATCTPFNTKHQALTRPLCLWRVLDGAVASTSSSALTARIIARTLGTTKLIASAKSFADTTLVIVSGLSTTSPCDTTLPRPLPGWVGFTPGLLTSVAQVLPHTVGLSGLTARATLQGSLRDECGPILSDWTWTVRNTAAVQSISSTKSAVTLVPVANGTSYVVGLATTTSQKDSSLVTVTGIGICTSSPTVICPGDNWQTVVDASPINTAFTIGAGTHVQPSVVPKTGNTFTGLPGAIMDGGRTLTGFALKGSIYGVGGQTQQGPVPVAGSCETGFPRCKYPEQLWVDGVLQTPVDTRASVAVGKWFFDYVNDSIFVFTNPNGHLVVTSVTPSAFNGTARAVTIRSLTVTHYASQWGSGGIQASGRQWLIDNVTMRESGGACLRITKDSVHVQNSKFIKCGQEGISGNPGTVTRKNITVTGSRLDSSNTAKWNRNFEGGAMKIANSDSAVFTGNHVEGNFGMGIWFDIDNRWTLIQHDTSSFNHGVGIFYEISYGCWILDNKSNGNGVTVAGGPYADGSGILVSASPDCEVARNAVTTNVNGIVLYQEDRGSGINGAHLVANANVHNNTVVQNSGTAGGFKGTFDQAAFSTSRNNCFTTNSYDVPAGATKFFVFNTLSVTDAAWQTSGCNASETILR